MLTNLKILLSDVFFPVLALFTLAVSMFVNNVPLSLPNVIMGLKLMSTIESPTVKIVNMI